MATKRIEWEIIEEPDPDPAIVAALDWLDSWGCLTDGAGSHCGHCNVCAPGRAVNP
jgi:7-cyano-7-deazaguanine synthase in queuosine biosynthesis